MAASRLIILGVAVAAALGAGYVAKNMVAAPPPEVVVEPARSSRRSPFGRAGAGGDVPMGQPVGDQLKWQSWPSDRINEELHHPRRRTRRDRKAAKVRSPASPLYAGEPLRRSKLIGEGQSFMSSILPSGKRAIATQISADTSAGGFILPNDYVDVIMTRRAAQGGAAAATASSPRPSSRTSACWPSTRPSRRTRKARRSRSARPRRWS